MIQIDLVGTFLASKYCFLKCFKEHGGCIINISAHLGEAGNALTSHAGSAKSGIDALTRHMAVEWGPYGVNVNSVQPGPILGRKVWTGYLLEKVKIMQKMLYHCRD